MAWTTGKLRAAEALQKRGWLLSAIAAHLGESYADVVLWLYGGVCDPSLKKLVEAVVDLNQSGGGMQAPLSEIIPEVLADTADLDVAPVAATHPQSAVDADLEEQEQLEGGPDEVATQETSQDALPAASDNVSATVGIEIEPSEIPAGSHESEVCQPEETEVAPPVPAEPPTIEGLEDATREPGPSKTDAVASASDPQVRLRNRDRAYLKKNGQTFTYQLDLAWMGSEAQADEILSRKNYAGYSKVPA